MIDIYLGNRDTPITSGLVDADALFETARLVGGVPFVDVGGQWVSLLAVRQIAPTVDLADDRLTRHEKHHLEQRCAHGALIELCTQCSADPVRSYQPHAPYSGQFSQAAQGGGGVWSSFGTEQPGESPRSVQSWFGPE